MATQPVPKPNNGPGSAPAAPAAQNTSPGQAAASAGASVRPEDLRRVPPQDVEAEMSLLGSMMLSNEAIGMVLPIIGREESDCFYRDEHRQLFEMLVDLYDKNLPVDLVLVNNELRHRNLLKRVGGLEYVVQLVESVPSWTNAEHYARIVHDKAMLRKLIACSGQILEEAYAQPEEAKAILDRAEQKLFAVTDQRISKQAVHINELISDVFDQIQIRGEQYLTGLPTGFVELDEKTSGFQRGEMIVVAARPSMGKTALALNMAEHMAVDNNYTAVFFSLEMSASQIVQRLLCSRGKIDSNAMRRGRLDEQEVNIAAQICGELQQASLYIDDTPGMTSLELRAKARRLKARANIDAIFVDYLQLMHEPGAESRQIEVSAMSRSLKALARELNVPVIVLSQLNRGPEGREGHRPRMSDLRESGAIEQDADVVLLLHREGYYRPEVQELQNTAELILAKQRNGPTGTVQVHFQRQFAHFGNLSHAPEPAGV